MNTHLNTILKSFVYILKILADWYGSSISIGSMGEKLPWCEICLWHFYRRTCMGLERVRSLKCQYIITQFFTCFILFEWAHLIDVYSAECIQHLYNRPLLTQMVHNLVHSSVGKILDEIFNWSVVDS